MAATQMLRGRLTECPTHYCLFCRFCSSGICQGTCWHMVYFFFFVVVWIFFFFFNRKALFVFFRGGSNQACGNTSTAICSAQFIQTGALDIKDKQKLSCYSRPHMCTLHFKYIGLCGVRGGESSRPNRWNHKKQLRPSDKKGCPAQYLCNHLSYQSTEPGVRECTLRMFSPGLHITRSLIDLER